MAVTVTPVADEIPIKLAIDTQANATAERDIFPGAGAKPFFWDIDNSNNAAEQYVKVYDNPDPTVGTTDPIAIFPATASTRITYSLYEIDPADDDDEEDTIDGLALVSALSMACVSGLGTSGTTSPTSSVTVRLQAF